MRQQQLQSDCREQLRRGQQLLELLGVDPGARHAGIQLQGRRSPGAGVRPVTHVCEGVQHRRQACFATSGDGTCRTLQNEDPAIRQQAPQAQSLLHRGDKEAAAADCRESSHDRPKPESVGVCLDHGRNLARSGERDQAGVVVRERLEVNGQSCRRRACRSKIAVCGGEVSHLAALVV